MAESHRGYTRLRPIAEGWGGDTDSRGSKSAAGPK
eukprot:CAMPEP_0174234292 /NCGR_PEP_ID=MMETSP0417-20130205/4092_1 /TAXON_ID=242541 /ORGANISM="Mayorella sp, Strain BSH-02190019" /LENGTH=34 /DNA_ID= /DNA_START= /DNA_END= /DNA_ORIENTATION=